MSKKILVVEDDKFLRELMTHKLDLIGYDVSSAVDGEKGVIAAGEVKPDLILLDLILPGIDGFEVLQKIKANPEISSIPVVVLSNLGQKEDIEKGLKLGAIDYMIKAHFTPNEIAQKAKSILKE